jgi:peptidoglycan/xylan/chitin deacetylase (PgdA/CDA1 family)
MPFPTSLEDQINVLQAHGRFFYQGNSALPEVALTFDDGPNPPYTNQVLALLKQYGVHATFFCVGSEVAAYPDLVRQEVAAGHSIGNHSWSHPLLTSLSAAEIRSQLTMTGDIIQQVTGTRPVFFRPPYGAVNAQVLTQVNQLSLTTFIWSDGSLDWTAIGPAAITHQVLSTVTNGAIILLHDGGGNRSRTLAALPSIIEGLQARHFRLVTLDQLVADANLKQTHA